MAKLVKKILILFLAVPTLAIAFELDPDVSVQSILENETVINLLENLDQKDFLNLLHEVMKWPKNSDGFVIVPYRIEQDFGKFEFGQKVFRNRNRVVHFR